MKRLILAALVFCALQFKGAQINGLFLTADDFKAGKLSYSSKTGKIKLHLIFRKEIVEIKQKDTIVTYKKSEVFGFSDKNGMHRFYNNIDFLILNPNEEILIYSIVSGTGMKNAPLVEHYFFSKTASSRIIPLTRRNLLQEFAANKTFCKALELYFRRDNELTEYNEVQRQYEINRLAILTRNE